MKMKRITVKLLSTVLAVSMLVYASCTKLEPDFGDGSQSESPSTGGGAPEPASLAQVYNELNGLIGQYGWHALQEHSTDELMGPTRGTDWDDFGTWRRLHLHTWDGAHNQVNDVWNNFNRALFQTTLTAELKSGQEQAEGKFLRAYFSYLVCDIYGQLQHRVATAPAAESPQVYTRSEAIDYIISELEGAVGALPTFTRDKRNMATKEAAYFLLAKSYLNRAVYKQAIESPAGPYNFDNGDMDKVIEYCNKISENAELALTPNYWDNFKWNNGSLSTENIFVRQNSQGINMRWYTSMGFHYNQTPSSWNGFTTLSDFYNSFDNVDIRKGGDLTGYTELTGAPVGFVSGQARGPATGRIGDPIVDLKDRAGNPLVFTPTASLFFSTETRGIRTNKYPLDPGTINDGGWGSQNEFVFFRFADARLMKAEALLRGGTDPNSETAASIVSQLHANRGLGAVSSIDLDGLLAERGYELYLEGWRRSDLVRFEKFNTPVEEREQASEGYRVVYPIPNIALSSNPNLVQNFGY